jgi:phosphate-selective porin OprO/OprP
MIKSVMIQSVRGVFAASRRKRVTGNKWGAIWALMATAGWSALAHGQDLSTLQSQLADLQAKVAALEKKQNASSASGRSGIDPELLAKLENQPVITLDSRGLRFASPEKTELQTVTGPDGRPTEQLAVVEEGDAYKFRLGTLLQPQGRFFLETPDDTSTFLMRRARLILDGTVYRNFDFLFQADLLASGLNNSTSTTVQDAWVNARAWDWLQLRAGKMKSPIGIERWQSANARWFTDMITTTYIVPNRSIGAMLHGKVHGGVAEYWASLVNGEPNGGSSDFSSDGQNTKEFQGRLALTPFAKTDFDPLKQLTVGAGVTYAPQLNGLGRYGTANQQQFFGYNASTISDARANPGEQVRFVPSASYFWGPFGAYAEAAWSTTGVVNGNDTANLNDFAWQVAASYLLTGEDSSYRAIKPKRPFNPSAGEWGALQIAARAGQLSVDDATFPTYANPETSARESTTFGVALNWILNENVKVSLEYDYTSFLGGAPDGANAPDNNAITTQVQLSF